MTDQNPDTKEKIMEVARILFANNGFEGTSVRDIAKAADVNVASVNYHFSSKDNLFSEILSSGYRHCFDDLKEFCNKNTPNTEEALVHLFKYFLGRSHDLVSYFKMMMSTQHSHHTSACHADGEYVGPPGGDIIIGILKSEVGAHVTDRDLDWAVKSLFSNVVHIAIMFNCCFKSAGTPFTSAEELEQNIRRLTRVVVKELKDS